MTWRLGWGRLFGSGKEASAENARAFEFKGGDIRADLRDRYGYDGDLGDLFAGHDGRIVHKWHHFLPLYDRYFSAWRDREVRFLEIGVSKGGSLELWRKWLGPKARICGVDIDPSCAAFDGEAAMVRIGSQDDPAFLRQVVEELGGIDLVLDDGSHTMEHVRASLDVLFPLLSDGGVYMIEDMHTAYWPSFGGGKDAPQNFFAQIGAMVDDMHHWYHRGDVSDPALAGSLAGIHIHDSIVVFDKAKVHPPVNSKVGRKR